MKILSGWTPLTPEGKENLVEATSLEFVWEKLEEFKKGVTEEAKREWNLDEALAIMRIKADWFIDERALELIRTYLFYRPNPSQAFPGRIGDQPSIWIQMKIVMDSTFGTML